jgi:phosphatidylserine/phosphatidylglycerophosphate/cardiolipin synthase-like enzyme
MAKFTPFSELAQSRKLGTGCRCLWWDAHFISLDYGFGKSSASAHLHVRTQDGKIKTIGEFVAPHLPAYEFAGEVVRRFVAGMQPTHIAECLQLLATEREANEQTVDRLQLVWTGPDVPGSVSRDTAVVVKELFTGARRTVLLSSFTVRRGSEVFASLAVAVDQNPSLPVRLAVNVGRDGDFSTPEERVLKRFSERFWQNHWPWPKRPCVYYDPRALSADPAVCANLHAKCVVIDDEVAFVTSANFTEWAQERNLEAGVLIRDASFARSLRNQFESLIAANRLRLLPGSAN